MGKNNLATSLFLAGAIGASISYYAGTRVRDQRILRGYSIIQEQIDNLDKKINSGFDNVETLENVRNGLVFNRQEYVDNNLQEIFEANEKLEGLNEAYWACFGIGAIGLAGLLFSRKESR